MRRPICASILLIALVGGCTTVNTDDDRTTPVPQQPTTSVTASVTATRTSTVTKEPPPPTVTRTTVVPPEEPQPRGPAEACDYTASQPTIKRGSQGLAVQQAQCYLNLSLTGEKLLEDGDFGPVTEAATRRFQSCAGIVVDGLIGPQTWSYLVYWASAETYLC